MVIAGNVGQNISKEQVRRRATTSQTAKMSLTAKMWLWEKKIAKHAEDCRLLEVTVNERKTDQSTRGDPVHS